MNFYRTKSNRKYKYFSFKQYKYHFYCVNTSYPMDNCFTGQRNRSRQTSEKDVLYIIPAGPARRVHSPGGASYFLFLSRHRDVIASFSFGAWRVKTCFLDKRIFYCVNTFYPMDNCLSGRHGPARQTSEKDVLCLHRLGRPSTVHSPDGVSYFLPV